MISRVRRLVGFFVLGAITDVLVVLYYRSVSGGMVFAAMWLSFLVTLVPFFVAERGITAGRRELFVAYAVGAAVGTGLGMLVRLV
jgi:hypothetical protein